MAGERVPFAARLPRSDVEAPAPPGSQHFQLDGGMGTTYERGSAVNNCWQGAPTQRDAPLNSRWLLRNHPLAWLPARAASSQRDCGAG